MTAKVRRHGSSNKLKILDSKWLELGYVEVRGKRHTHGEGSNEH